MKEQRHNGKAKSLNIFEENKKMHYFERIEMCINMDVVLFLTVNTVEHNIKFLHYSIIL